MLLCKNWFYFFFSHLLTYKNSTTNLQEKAATMKRFEYSPLDKETKAQTDITKKQYKN